jgi:hypothetical protein
MKTLLSLLLAFSFVLGAYSQEQEKLSKTELKKLQKEQKKAEEAAQREQMAALTSLMITNRRFVLEADFLSNKTGTRVPVQAMINFIMVDSLNGTVQFGSALAAGYNGVGGTTMDGKISNYKYTMIGKKKDSYSISMNFMSTLGSYDITMMVNPEGYADATIRGNWSGSLSYHGKLVPPELSRIYKGHPAY